MKIDIEKIATLKFVFSRSALVLPKTANPTDPRVILVRPGLYDPNIYTIVEIMAVMSSIMRVSLIIQIFYYTHKK